MSKQHTPDRMPITYGSLGDALDEWVSQAPDSDFVDRTAEKLYGVWIAARTAADLREIEELAIPWPTTVDGDCAVGPLDVPLEPREGGGALLAERAVRRDQRRAKAAGGRFLESDRFIVHEVIGRGGASVVLRAFDKNIQRDVAVKVLPLDILDCGAEHARFAKEARIAGQLEHPNILPVYEFGLDGQGRRFLCMRLVEGKTLEEALNLAGERRFAPSDLAEFLEIFVKVCDGVSFAHSRGVIHRDLKPSNIMIGDFGQVYVLDWGVARLLPTSPDRGLDIRPRLESGGRGRLDAPGALIGTPCYMAPEQVRGLHDKHDERTDVFALGATLYQILTGQPPLTADMIRAIWMGRPTRPIAFPDVLVAGGRIHVELSKIALQATSYDPADRYCCVADLKREIESFRRGAWSLPR